MKKIVCLLFISALAISLVFAGGSRDKGSSEKIVIYTSMYPEAIEHIQKEIQSHFPGTTIEFISRASGVIEGLVAAETESGRLGCDILMIAEPSYSFELKEKGMLHPFKSAAASGLVFDYDPDGYWYPVRISNMVLAFNPDRNTRETLPGSFQGFANDNRVRGAVSMRNPLVSGTSMATITALRDLYGYEYFDTLGGQRVMIDYGSADTIRKLETGETRVAMILEESILRVRQIEHSKLEVIYPSDGVVVIPSTIMIINNRWSANRNIRAAEAITEWFLSPSGQNAIVAGWMHSVRANFDKLPFDAKPTSEITANSMPVNWENVLHQRDEIKNNFEERVTARR